MLVSYDSSAASAATGRLRTTAGDLAHTLEDLSSHVTALCGAWEGDEQVVYQDIQRRWSSAAGEIHQILTRITSSLDENTQAVDRMRAQVRRTLAG